MKIIVTPDCNNAPKKALIRDFSIAAMKVEVEKVRSYLSEDIDWIIVGTNHIKGIDEFIKTIEHIDPATIEVFEIMTILTHGKEAALHGMIKSKDGSIFQYSDFYIFSSSNGTKIKKLVSFNIKTN